MQRVAVYSCVAGYSMAPHIDAPATIDLTSGKPLFIRPLYAAISAEKPIHKFTVIANQKMRFSVVQDHDPGDPKPIVRMVVLSPFQLKMLRMLQGLVTKITRKVFRNGKAHTSIHR